MFYAITFPFFFGVMFGDIGHGSLVFAIGLIMVLAGDSVPKDLVDSRWCFLLMGFYATYCGLIYNDFMSIPTNIFGSCYDVE